MALWSRLFSRDAREARAAEARGALAEAAAAYARAGRTADEVRVRWLLARQESGVEARARQLRALRAAADGRVPAKTSREIEIELARVLLQLPGEPGALEEAASLFERAGEYLAASDALLALGRYEEARRALASGRHFEKLEEVDRSEAERRARSHRLGEALAGAQSALSSGDRSGALRRLAAVTADTDAPRALRDEAADSARRIEEARPRARLSLAVDGAGSPVTCVTEMPVILGRDERSPLPLRDPGVSRQHTRIRHREGAFFVEDLESRNGTLIDGVPVAGSLELGGPVRLGLGERCEIALAVSATTLRLTVERGLAAGACAALVVAPVPLGELLSEPGLEGELTFDEGWFRVCGLTGARLNGTAVAAGGPIELLVGDRVEVGRLVLEARRS